MHLTVLSRSSALYTTRRLVDAARIAGHRARVIDPLRCEVYVAGGQSTLLYRRKPMPRTDACIPRIGQSVQTYGLAVLDQLARLGVPLLNSSEAISRSRAKLSCLEHLSAQGVPVPATVLANDAREITEMVSMVGGCPVLIKLLHGAERTGVMVCETPQSMEAALEALLALGHDVMVQEYVRDVKGRDLRALVVGGRVVAAVRRRARVGRLARTLGAGARFEGARLRPELARLAERTAQLVGLEVAAVDMLDGVGGPKVFEVISSPGIQEIEHATGVDVARVIVERAAALARARPKKKKGMAASHEQA
ncbi:MAG: RimK family alpha-L-glutamate ligase [Deltaproteobacteria bacterium]|nr:RimK family alpha-L-glutamate ligase [Deltaproteobacteria bacterium]